MTARTADALQATGITDLALSVYDLLVQRGPMDRAAIVQKLSRHRTTIYDALKHLERMGLVARRPHYITGQSRGRPRVEFYIVGRDG